MEHLEPPHSPSNRKGRQKQIKKTLSVEINALTKENRTERRRGRTLTIQALYAFECHRLSNNDIPIETLCRFEWMEELKPSGVAFATDLVKGSILNLIEIDSIIKPRLVDWEFDRISIINKAILRLSIYQLLYRKDIPSTVVINEAVDLAKKFGESEDYKFVNALLDKFQGEIVKEI